MANHRANRPPSRLVDAQPTGPDLTPASVQNRLRPSRSALPAVENTLHNLPLFKDTDAAAREAMQESARYHDAAKHELIMSQGDLGFDLFMVVAGCVMIARTDGWGAQQVVGFLFAGGLSGAVAIDTYVNSARSVVPTTVVGFDHATISNLTDAHPSLRRALYRSTISDIGVAQDHLVILGAMNAQERVAAALLHFDRCQRARDPIADKPLWLPMRRTDLANYLAIELPTLSRVLSRFRDHKLLSFQSISEIWLCDRQRLARLSGEDWTVDTLD